MKKLLLFSLSIIFQLVAMEQEQPHQQIQSLEAFVYSLNNTPEAIKILPLEIEQHCIAIHVMHDKQLWYPTKTIPLPNNRIDAAYFSNNSSHIFLNVWDVPAQKNQLQKLDLCSNTITATPIPIDCKQFSAIPSNNNKLYALIQHHTESIRELHSQIHIVDAQTNSLTFSFPHSEKKIKTVQWSADDTRIMSDNGDIWNIETKENKRILPEQKWVPTKAVWNKNNTQIAMQDCLFLNDIVIYDSDSGEKISIIEVPKPVGHFDWKNNTEIFTYDDSMVIITDVLSEQRTATIYNPLGIGNLCCNHDGTLFLTWTFKKSNRTATLWQRYTEFTPQQAFFYWLLHKWVLLKKLNPKINSIKELLDDIVSYFPLDKIALLTIWKTFPKMVRKTIWEHKMNYFIEHKYHKPTTGDYNYIGVGGYCESTGLYLA